MVVCLEQEEGPVDSRSTAVSSRHTRTQIRLAAVMAAFLSLLPAPCWAADYSAAIVADLTSGQVLFSQAAEEPRFPASLTKMMTLYVLFEDLERKWAAVEGCITRACLLRGNPCRSGSQPAAQSARA